MVAFRAVVLLVAVAAHCVPGIAANAAPTVSQVVGVPFVSTQLGQVVVPVTLGGFGPYLFLLDTGSSHTAVSRELADLVGFPQVAKASMTTPTGTIEIAVVRLDRVGVGPVHADELLASVLPAGALDVFGSGAWGVLGQDFLQRFNYTLDYRRSTVLWSEEPDTSASERLTLVTVDGRFLVELPQIGSSPLRFVPDSGANSLFVFNAAAVGVSGVRTSAQVQSLVGGTTAVAGTVEVLRVGRRTLRHQPAFVLTVDGPGHAGEDGLLPLHLFRRVHFNNIEGYMTVE